MKKMTIIILIAMLTFSCIGIAMASDIEGKDAPPSVSVNPSLDQPGSPIKSYSKYYYLFCPGTMSVTELPDTIVAQDKYYGWGHRITFNAPGSGSYGGFWLDCPLVGFASITGVHPKIRYMTFQVRTQASWPEVDVIHMYNGKDKFKESDVSWWNSDGAWHEYTYDMDAYYDYYRGLNADLYCRTYGTYANWIEIGGYGAKMEYD